MTLRRSVLSCIVVAIVVASLPLANEPPGYFDGSWRARYAVGADSLYKSPINIALTRDGEILYVLCENTAELLRVDTRAKTVTGSVKLTRKAFGLALSPDEGLAYVTNRWDHSISVADLSRLEIVRTLEAGIAPRGIVADLAGEWLYAANLSTHSVSVIDAATGIIERRLQAGRQPFGAALSPDGKLVAVTSQLTRPVGFREPPETEITIIDTERRFVLDHRPARNTVIQQGVTWTPDSKWILAVAEVPRNLIPETQVYQGWMVTYALIVAEARPGGKTAYLLLDDVNRYYPDPFGVVCSADGRYVYVSSSGVDLISVLDWRGIERVLKIRDDRIGVSADSIALFARHLGISDEYVVGRVPTGRNPKAMALSPDGGLLYVANRLSDNIGIVDIRERRMVDLIDLGGPDIETELRRGEYLFNHAAISFQQQMACNTCHPENNVDGLLYDIAIDGGMGLNVVDNRTMRGVAATGPFKWNAKNPTLHRQEGPRAAQLFFRSHGFEPADVDAIVHYIESTPLQPNPYVRADGRLTPAQRRGKALFERRYTNTGEYIPIANRCITCHDEPLYMDGKLHDVGSKLYHDLERHVDTPQLNRVYDTAPYMHDGRCWTLEEIWTVFNPDDLHGKTNDMTKEQLNNLIEYMKTF